MWLTLKPTKPILLDIDGKNRLEIIIGAEKVDDFINHVR